MIEGKAVKEVEVTSVEVIPVGAFFGADFITSIVLHDEVKTIENFTFQGCYSLKKATINCKKILEAAFYDCTALSELEFGENLTTIGAGAFQGCTSLSELQFSENITESGPGAFADCSSLKHSKIQAFLKICASKLRQLMSKLMCDKNPFLFLKNQFI